MTDRPAPDAFDLRRYRDALSIFPTGVTVITTAAADGTLVGVTANSFSSVSLDPPLILFSLARTALSLETFLQANAFAVNILSYDQGAISNRFAMRSADKWQDIAYQLSPLGSPILEGALATFECKTQSFYDGGDHVILLGHVIDFHERADGEPLVFFRGAYRQLSPREEYATSYSANEPRILPPLTAFDPWISG